MAGLADVRSALGKALKTLPGMQTASGYMLSNPTPPTADVMPAGIDYHQTSEDGLETLRLLVRVFMPFTTDIGSQQLLDEFLAESGPKSVKALLEADPTLGGVCDDVIVRDVSGYKQYTGGTAPVLGAEWSVEVLSTPGG